MKDKELLEEIRKLIEENKKYQPYPCPYPYYPPCPCPQPYFPYNPWYPDYPIVTWISNGSICTYVEQV